LEVGEAGEARGLVVAQERVCGSGSIIQELVRRARSRARAWVSKSPSTQDLRLIYYQLRKHGMRKVFTNRYYDDVFYQEYSHLRPAYDVLGSALEGWAHPASVCDFGCGPCDFGALD